MQDQYHQDYMHTFFAENPYIFSDNIPQAGCINRKDSSKIGVMTSKMLGM